MRILDIRRETDFTHINLFSARYLDKSEKERGWIFASRKPDPAALKHKNTPDAVVVVPYHVEEDKLVMIREFRVPLGRVQYGFPAGLVDNEETIEATATRELHEETGLTIVRLNQLSPIIYSSSGLTDESLALVYVDCAGSPTSRHTNDSEDIEVVMLSQSQARRLKAHPDTCFDVKSWLVMNTFAETGRILA
ncbi:MAG: NUDIX hydrolase [Desulfosudaceae bacterium]